MHTVALLRNLAEEVSQDLNLRSKKESALIWYSSSNRHRQGTDSVTLASKFPLPVQQPPHKIRLIALNLAPHDRMSSFLISPPR
jgi:hypothetical protein